MNRAGRGQRALIKMKLFHAKHPALEIAMLFQEWFYERGGDAASARDCEVRRPGAFFDRQSAGESGLVDAFVQLKQVRMGLSDADPENARLAVFRENGEASDRKKECTKGNGAELFFQCFCNGRRDAGEEGEGEVNL